MGLMGTLAKVAIGYAAARGVDKMSGGGGLGALLGGGAQVPAEDPNAKIQAQAGQMMTGNMPEGAGNPMQDMMAKLQEGGLGGLMGGLGGAAGGDNPMAAMMEKLQSSTGMDLSAMMGGGAGTDTGGGNAGLAGMMASMTGAAAMQGQGAGAMLDSFNTKETAPQAEEAAGLMLRAMIQAAKSDGGIDASEKDKILGMLGDDADAQDMAFIQAQLEAPIDVASLAADTPDMQKAQVYSASLMTITVDSQVEAQYLDALAKALGLPETTVNALHYQMGVHPLYA